MRPGDRPSSGAWETILGSDVVVTPGGKGANQAVAAGRLGGDVAFVGRVRGDDHGRLLRASLADANVDVTGLRIVNAPSGIAVIMLSPDGENSIVVAPGANRHVTPPMLEEQGAWESAAAVVVLQLEICARVGGARRHPGPGSHPPQHRPAVALPAEVLAAADPLVANKSEAHHLLGDDRGDGARLARRLLDQGPRSVALTLGAEGAAIAERDDDGEPQVRAVPAHRVRPVDTTGAHKIRRRRTEPPASPCATLPAWPPTRLPSSRLSRASSTAWCLRSSSARATPGSPSCGRRGSGCWRRG